MNKYRITREEYYNEFGSGGKVSFYVQELKPFFFFWKRWSYIKHEVCGWGDCYNERTKFDSMHSAKEFIKTVLCTGLERNRVSKIIMGEFNCVDT